MMITKQFNQKRTNAYLEDHGYGLGYRIAIIPSEEGAKLSYVQNEAGRYIDPDMAIELAYAILHYYEAHGERIKQERAQYVEQRQREDFKREIKRMHSNIRRSLRKQVLKMTKKGGHRGINCKQCGDYYSTKIPQHLNMPFQYLFVHYEDERLQNYYYYECNSEFYLEYVSDEDRKLLKRIKKNSMSLMGNYCSTECAQAKVDAWFHGQFPQWFPMEEYVKE